MLAVALLSTGFSPIPRFAAPSHATVLRTTTPICGWGPDPIWTPNEILSIDDVAAQS